VDPPRGVGMSRVTAIQARQPVGQRKVLISPKKVGLGGGGIKSRLETKEPRRKRQHRLLKKKWLPSAPSKILKKERTCRGESSKMEETPGKVYKDRWGGSGEKIDAAVMVQLR